MINPADFMPYIDINEGLSRLMNNKKLYGRLLKSYLTQINYDDIAAKLVAGEFEPAREAIHTFKGVSANLSIAENYHLSAALEATVKQAGDYKGALAALKVSIDKTTVLLNTLITQIDAELAAV